MFLAEQILALVKTARYDRRGRTFVAELVGGYELTIRRITTERPSLPPPNFAAEPVARPGIAKCPTNVVAFRARRTA